MSDTQTELKIATPEQIAKAWEAGVMYGTERRAAEKVAAHPPTIADPTYYREGEGVGGWHSATDITSPSAQRGLAGWLEHKWGARVPDATRAAWDESNRRLDVRDKILDHFKQAMKGKTYDELVALAITFGVPLSGEDA